MYWFFFRLIHEFNVLEKLTLFSKFEILIPSPLKHVWVCHSFQSRVVNILLMMFTFTFHSQKSRPPISDIPVVLLWILPLVGEAVRAVKYHMPFGRWWTQPPWPLMNATEWILDWSPFPWFWNNVSNTEWAGLGNTGSELRHPLFWAAAAGREERDALGGDRSRDSGWDRQWFWKQASRTFLPRTYNKPPFVSLDLGC